MGFNFAFVPLLLLSISWVTCNAHNEEFLHCLSLHSSNISHHLYSPKSPNYLSLLQTSQQNARWLNSTSPKPLFILTPQTETEIQTAVICAKQHGLQIRVRSGGHDYEGQSFLCPSPFILIELINYRSINIDVKTQTAWVQTGATLGELYYSIGQKSGVLGFPGGTCPSVGVGGHISGGGFGMLARKYGLAADNVVDARLIDVNGRILDRKTMGEDLFWAIRGSGGASFGVVTAWKLKLVRVPPTVTTFRVNKFVNNESATEIINKWQHVADKLPKDLLIRVVMAVEYPKEAGQAKSIKANFQSLFLGTTKQLIPLMNERFPELGLKETDCNEMPWINSTVLYGVYKPAPLEVLLKREVRVKNSYKGKTDFVQKPIPESAFQGIWDKFMEEDRELYMIFDPFGGKLNEISESALPFPHRKGNLFNIQYSIQWKNETSEEKRHMDWIRGLYDYMEPYVTSSPRAAYINYKDLDLGKNKADGSTCYSEAKVWGEKYFKGNFERLALVKGRVDPENFFRNEQSIPVLRK